MVKLKQGKTDYINFNISFILITWKFIEKLGLFSAQVQPWFIRWTCKLYII